MNKLIKNIKFLEIFFLIIISLSPLLWLNKDQIILGHDAGFRLDSLSYYHSLFYSWSPVNNFGVDWSIFKGFLIAQFPETFFIFITNSIQLGEKLSFIFWFFAIGMSMYIFVNSFFPQRKFWIFRLFSSILYMYNFFLLQGWFIAERAKFSLFAALPLGLLIIYKLLNKEINLIKGTIIFSFIFLFLNGGGNPTLYGSIILVYFIAFIYLTFINYLKDGVKELLYSIKVLFGLIVGTFLINAYWILPQIYLIINKYSSSLLLTGGISGILQWEQVVSQYASFINLFRLEGIPDWYNNINHPYANYFIENPLLIILSFIPIFTILLGLLLYKKINIKDRNDQLFYLIFILFLVGIVFAAGSHPPLDVLYISLIKHVPGFAIFRSAFYKFGPAYWFSFIFLAGYLLNLLLLNYVKKKYIYNFVGFLVVMFIILYHFPFFAINFFEFNKPFTTKVNIPSYVEDASSYVNKNISEDSRILILPKLYPDFIADSYSWGFWSLDILPRLSIDRSIIANDNNSPQIIQNLYDAIDNKNENEFLKLAGLMGVNVILWRDDVLYTNKSTKSADLKEIENNLKSFKSVSLEKEFDKWRLYKINNPYYKPLFYVPDQIVYAFSDKSLSGKILNTTNSINPEIIFSDSTLNKDTINKNIENYYFKANCILCNENELQNIKNQVILPFPELLPGSRFYFITNYLEQRLINKYKNNIKELIDVDLTLSNKRLSQVLKLLTVPRADREKQVKEAGDHYQYFVSDAINRSNNLSFEDKNYYFIKIYAYLLKQSESIGQLLPTSERLFDYSYKSLSEFQKNKVDFLESNIWKTNYKEDAIRYIVNLNYDGFYNLLLNVDSLAQQIKIDNKIIDSNQNLKLSKGTHGIEVIMPKGYAFLKKDIYSHQYMSYPSILFQLKGKEKIMSTPNIKFVEIDQTKYLVNVVDSKNPFILNFGESFDKGWKAYYVDSKGDKIKLAENNHFESNGYANAWEINKKGNYKILIQYEPQTVFYYGLIITLISLFGYIIVYLIINEKNNKN